MTTVYSQTHVKDILYGVKSGRGGRYQVATFSLRWIKLGDVPKIVNLYSDSIYRDKTPEQLQAVDQLIAKQREYMTMLDSIERNGKEFEIRSNRNVSLPESFVEECLANGHKLKATGDRTIEVDVVQGDLEDGHQFGLEYGRELFNFRTKINPQSDDDNEARLLPHPDF